MRRGPEDLTRVSGVANMKSRFALNQVKYSTALQLQGVWGRARRGNRERANGGLFSADGRQRSHRSQSRFSGRRGSRVRTWSSSSRYMLCSRTLMPRTFSE